MTGRDVLVFDMDGVLVDVSESYREAIRHTVQHFTGTLPSHDRVQDYKNAGGWNNDWALSHKMCADLGVEVEYGAVVDYFQSIFLGSDGSGLISREKWIGRAGLLEKLATHLQLGIFTGRPRAEADITLRRFAPAIQWDLIVADEDVANAKPAPDGLLQFRERFPQSVIWYVGDTVDDAQSARAAGARFIGIAERRKPRYGELVELLRRDGAVAVLESINELESVLPLAARSA